MGLIHIKNLHRTFEHNGVKTHALRGVTLDIEAGEFISLMGPSGSGKSTLLHILGFLDRHTKGSYKFRNRLIDNLDDDDLAQVRNSEIGFVFQSFNLLSRMTVYQNVELPLLYSNVPQSEWKPRIEKAIEEVGMTHRISFPAVRLSGGEKQRAAIARALVMKPKVIFADEPTGNLDSVSGRKVMEVLQGLHTNQGHTIILITHETDTANHAQRIIRLRDGQLESDEKVKKRRFASKDFRK